MESESKAVGLADINDLDVGIDPQRAILVQDERTDEHVIVEDHRDGRMEFIQRMQHPMAMTIVSKRNTGKSYFLRAYIREIALQERLDMIVAFSKTSYLNSTFDFLPSRYVFQGYSEKVMRAIFREMSNKVMKLRKDATDDPSKEKRAPHLIVVLDDVVGETLPIGSGDNARSSTGRCSTLSEIYAMGRHFKTSIIVLTQTATVVLNPTIRNNNDYLLIGTNNEDATEPLYKSTNGFASLKAFRRFAANATANHTLIMYDNLDARGTNVKWYLVRAPENAIDYELDIDTAEGRENKRKRQEEEKQARARRRLEEREKEMQALHLASEMQSSGEQMTEEDITLRNVANEFFRLPNYAAGVF